MRFLLITAAMGVFGVMELCAQPTSEQIAAGQAVYKANCASCHRADLSGGGEAPQLAGANFMNTWGARPATDLINYMQSAMPPSNPGGLSAKAYIDLAAYILEKNGKAVAAKPSEAAAAVKEQTTAGRGLTVTGQVKNYVPVTDAMLRNPDPGDWLMIRRNYQAWSNSPLAQINTGNVKNLRLVWEWAMNEVAAANEPTPLITTGSFFLLTRATWCKRLTAEPATSFGRIASVRKSMAPTEDAKSGSLSRQGVPRDHRCADPGAGRAHRQNRLGNRDRRSRGRATYQPVAARS